MNPNEPAYPFQEMSITAGANTSAAWGLTKRELFAAMALQGMLFYRATPDQCAQACVEYADALIAALSKEPNEASRT